MSEIRTHENNLNDSKMLTRSPKIADPLGNHELADPEGWLLEVLETGLMLCPLALTFCV